MMNLRQIIRNQKTQKFDLTSLVRDTEDKLHESSTGSSSGAAVTSSTWATIKSLYESEEYDKLLKKQITDVFEIAWNDNVKARLVNRPRSKYIKSSSSDKLRSQWSTYDYYKSL